LQLSAQQRESDETNASHGLEETHKILVPVASGSNEFAHPRTLRDFYQYATPKQKARPF